jgi:hypothetical protein
VLDSLTHMSAGLCECVCGNDCGGGGCLELSICDYVSECLDGRRTDGGGRRRRKVHSHKGVFHSLIIINLNIVNLNSINFNYVNPPPKIVYQIAEMGPVRKE